MLPTVGGGAGGAGRRAGGPGSSPPRGRYSRCKAPLPPGASLLVCTNIEISTYCLKEAVSGDFSPLPLKDLCLTEHWPALKVLQYFRLPCALVDNWVTLQHDMTKQHNMTYTSYILLFYVTIDE